MFKECLINYLLNGSNGNPPMLELEYLALSLSQFGTFLLIAHLLDKQIAKQRYENYNFLCPLKSIKYLASWGEDFPTSVFVARKPRMTDRLIRRY